MTRLVWWVDKGLSGLLSIMMSCLVLDVFWQVFTRFVLKTPSSFTQELATFLLIWIGLLGSALALRQKAHLGIDILTTRMTPELRYVWEFVIYSTVILFSLLVLIWGGLRLVNITLHLNQISAALRIKMGYVYSVLPITGALLIFYALHFMMKAFWGLRTHRFQQLEQSTVEIE